MSHKPGLTMLREFPIVCGARRVQRYRLSPSPRLRREGRGEGRFFEFGHQCLESSFDVLDDIVVSDTDHAVTEGPQVAVAYPVFGTLRVLAAIEFDNQAPLATHKIDVVAADRLLADEFEATQLSAANACPQGEFCRRERAPQ